VAALKLIVLFSVCLTFSVEVLAFKWEMSVRPGKSVSLNSDSHEFKVGPWSCRITKVEKTSGGLESRAVKCSLGKDRLAAGVTYLCYRENGKIVTQGRSLVLETSTDGKIELVGLSCD
jgi:hypothetical protein